MDKAFPDVRYILNTRDPERVLGSGFWVNADAVEARALIDRVREVQAHLRETRPDRVFDVTYEVLTGEDTAARDEMVRGLGEFATGAPVPDAVLDDLRATLGTAHGPFPFARGDVPGTDDADG
jgi:hypothetical protein